MLVIGLGGTIGSVRNDKISLDSNTLKVVNFCDRDDVSFDCDTPFSVLSEDMSIELWRKLIDYLGTVEFDRYDGVIILHGSDTLAYTAGLIGNAYPNESIALVASDKPIEDDSANGIANFNLAVDEIARGLSHPIVCYDTVHNATSIKSANANDEFISISTTLPPVDSRTIYDKNILIINAYPGMDMNNYSIDRADAVIVDMFHSATVPKCVIDYAEKSDTPFYFVTHKTSAEYETAQGIDNIIYSCTAENLYARLLLTK